uniref:Uncharacterized protein n=1 Tax=Panagrolaimus davidi TaxID=227884 RepID=A0A914QUW4_9BILA
MLGNLVFLRIFGAQSKKDIGLVICGKDTFVLEFINVFKNSKLKAFIFQINGTPDNVEFIRMTKINLALLQIPCVYFTLFEQMRSAILIASNIDLNVGDRIVEVLIDDTGYTVSELEYTDKGYLEHEQRDCKPYKNMTPETIRQRILGPNNPFKIICHAFPGKETTKFLTSKVLNKIPKTKWIVIEEDLNEYDGKFVFETVKWIFEKSYTKYYVCQKSFRNYMIRAKYGDEGYPIILCRKHDILPFKEVVTIPKSFLTFCGHVPDVPKAVAALQAATDNTDTGVTDLRSLEIPKEVHALKFSLEIDVSNFTLADVTGIIFNKISRLPAQLDAKKFEIPVIGFYGELSFIYVKNDDGYKFLDSWNGKLGKDLYISFDEEKPRFFNDAVEKFLTNGKSVVHDLIKIMSTSPSDLSSHHPYGYKISSDSEHPILILIENHLGEKKAASPSFLMAMLLKKHLKELRKKTGKAPNKIGFCLFDDFKNNAEGKKRLENGLKESCQMLKGVECCFIEAV